MLENILNEITLEKKWDFITKFTCKGEESLTCTSSELRIKCCNTLVDNIYTSGDILTTGTYIIYGRSVDNILFGELDPEEGETQLRDNFTSIEIIRNVKQTNARNMFYNLKTLTLFEAGPDAFGSVIDFYCTWDGCSGITEFPLINTSKGKDFSWTWNYCTKLKELPLLDFSSGVIFDFTWDGCVSLTLFPLIDTSNGIYFESTWCGCKSFAGFPLLDFSRGKMFESAWNGCSGFNTFPIIDISHAENINGAWVGCAPSLVVTVKMGRVDNALFTIVREG